MNPTVLELTRIMAISFALRPVLPPPKLKPFPSPSQRPLFDLELQLIDYVQIPLQLFSEVKHRKTEVPATRCDLLKVSLGFKRSVTRKLFMLVQQR